MAHKRKRGDEEVPAMPRLPGDDWALDVESVLTSRTPQKRNAVIQYMAALLLVRRWVSMNRLGKSRDRQYSHLPKPLLPLARLGFPGHFIRSGGGSRAPGKTTVLHVLQVMKVNDEAYDHCTRVLEGIMQAVADPAEASIKAYVAARTYSRVALGLPCWRKKWASLGEGVSWLLADTLAAGHEPRELFTQSFGPNCRRYSECVGTMRGQSAYVRDCFSQELPPLQWLAPVGSSGKVRHATKEEVYAQLLTWPGVGPLTAKNLYQLLRLAPCVQGFRAAAGNARQDSSNYFAMTSAGARMAISLLFAEPGGRGFLRDAASIHVLRHFSPFVLSLRKAFLKAMRDFACNCSVLLCLVRSFESQDENFWCFFLCEIWKVLAYLATGDVRYERGQHDS
ncbi:unnamed protein product [Effrenium voratum]|nr:unnamed protein product [Effrenium voratum]